MLVTIESFSQKVSIRDGQQKQLTMEQKRHAPRQEHNALKNQRRYCIVLSCPSIFKPSCTRSEHRVSSQTLAVLRRRRALDSVPTRNSAPFTSSCLAWPRGKTSELAYLMRSSSIVVSDPAVVLPGRGPRRPTRINDLADTVEPRTSTRRAPKNPRGAFRNIEQRNEPTYLERPAYHQGIVRATSTRGGFGSQPSPAHTHLGLAHVVVARRRLESQAIPADAPYLPIQHESLLVVLTVGGIDCTNGHAVAVRGCRAASTGSASNKKTCCK
ncbi:hypothetical protein HMN09_00680400 [Mycena chlorophos]|uniref:Uncharacterized protein n=1 Tax=Mycena chlorophos TaxID=658473 RepID=A0A8H6SYH4_MYCCL|nr:hypothetical protein HMN09_00680400 [Mycena chlorophos]